MIKTLNNVDCSEQFKLYLAHEVIENGQNIIFSKKDFSPVILRTVQNSIGFNPECTKLYLVLFKTVLST